MCGPVLGLVMGAAQTVFSMYSSMAEASAAQRAANATANSMERQANEVEEQRREELKVHRRQARMAQAEHEAEMAAGGADISRGTAGSLLADHAQIREEDAGQINLEADRRKRNLRENASATRASGQSSGLLAATGPLLAGGARMADRWQQWRRNSG